MTERREHVWMAQWRAAEAALVEIRRQELAGLSEQDSAELFNRCAMPAGDFWLSPERLQSSGLVAQQKYFMRSRSHASCR